MVQQSLTEYVNKLLKSGYDVGAVRTTLINSGYSPVEVNQALSYAKTGPKKQISLNLKILIIGAISIILVILVILGAVWLLTPEPKEISLAAEPVKTEAYPGDAISFLVELTSDVERIEPVLLTYELIDPKAEKIVLAKQDRLEIGRKRSLTVQISLPADINPGTYEIKIILSYKLGTKQRKFNFNVIETPDAAVPTDDYAEEFVEEEVIEEVKCPESCDDFNPCTIDFCEKGLCKHTPKVPCCGNGICEEGESILNCADDCSKTKKTPQEIIQQAKTVATADPEAAAMLCNKLIRPNDIDLCFSEVAQTSGKSVICENIQTQDNKDTCYMEFAIDGDYSVCPKVLNSYLSKSCNSLKRSSIMLAQAEGIAEEFKQ